MSHPDLISTGLDHANMFQEGRAIPGLSILFRGSVLASHSRVGTHVAVVYFRS